MFFLLIEKDLFLAFCPELKKFRVISDDKNQKLGWSVNSLLFRWKVEPTPWEKRKMIILSFCSVLNRVFHIHDLQTDLLGQLYLKVNIHKVFRNFWHSFGSFMIFLRQSLFWRISLFCNSHLFCDSHFSDSLFSYSQMVFIIITLIQTLKSLLRVAAKDINCGLLFKL